MFWNPQDLLLMMGTEIFKIDASWEIDEIFEIDENESLISNDPNCRET